MNEFSNQQLARNLLEARETGYNFGLFLRRNKWSYPIFFIVLAVMLYLTASRGLWSGFWFVLGAVLGSVLREIRWVHARGKAWPFTVKVLDWEKVEKLAKGELM